MKERNKSRLEYAVGALGLLLLAFLVAGGNASASGGGDDDDQSQGQSQGQDQGQAQGQEQQTEVNVNIGGGTDASGNSVPLATAAGGSVTLNQEAQGDYKVDFRNNPNVYTNPPMPTVPCYKTGGFGASGAGVGLSLGGGKIDPYCTMREEIRLGHAIGLGFQATWMWCNMENVVEIFGDATQCLQAATSKLSPEYHLLLTEKERIERELRETQSILLQRCVAAEEQAAEFKESGDRAHDAWLACQRK